MSGVVLFVLFRHTAISKKHYMAVLLRRVDLLNKNIQYIGQSSFSRIREVSKSKELL